MVKEIKEVSRLSGFIMPGFLYMGWGNSENDSVVGPGFYLKFADGFRWGVRAVDDDAKLVVNTLARVMGLKAGQKGRELLVSSDQYKKKRIVFSGKGPVVCSIYPPVNNDMLHIGMSQVALTLVRDIQSRGGMLLHGALAEYPEASPGQSGKRGDGRGILLAGPGTVGKTTASNRLPSPWRALCDDTSLVVRDETGRYWAHPWPTWSRFHDVKGVPGPGGSWDVQHAVPLRAVFILSQSARDRAEKLSSGAAIPMIMEVVHQVSDVMTRQLSGDDVQAIHREQLDSVEALVETVPVYTLEISLAGEFWKEIERVLRLEEPEEIRLVVPVTPRAPVTGDAESIDSRLDDGILHVVYTGPSMNPTLREPDLLEVEPYEDRPLRPGDVIYYRSPEKERRVVHRVKKITSGGIHTRGDHNTRDDPYVLSPEAVIGRVKGARRGTRRRRIAGGWPGSLRGFWCRFWRFPARMVSRLLHRSYHGLARSGVFQRFLPRSLSPKVFVFRSRKKDFLKMLMGNKTIGQYDPVEKKWRIRRPFLLFINPSKLPLPDSFPGTVF